MLVYNVDDVGQTQISCKMQNAPKNNDVFYPENYELRAGYISLILYFAKQTKRKKYQQKLYECNNPHILRP